MIVARNVHVGSKLSGRPLLVLRREDQVVQEASKEGLRKGARTLTGIMEEWLRRSRRTLMTR
jgi:hypothetical protein